MPSCEEISSDSQMEMTQVEAAQLAVEATTVAGDGSNAAVFSGSVVLTELFRQLLIIFGFWGRFF